MLTPQPSQHRKTDGACTCGRTPDRGEPTLLARDARTVVGCKACSLDCLTRSLTAAPSFEDLLAPGGTYWPTIYPDSEDAIRLRLAYDLEQAKRGDPRRCYPPAKQGPVHHTVTGLFTSCRQRMDATTATEGDWTLVTCERCLEPGARQKADRVLAADNASRIAELHDALTGEDRRKLALATIRDAKAAVEGRAS